MADTIDATAARRRFGELTRRVANGERFLIQRNGMACVAMVSPADAALAEAVQAFAVAHGLEGPPAQRQRRERRAEAGAWGTMLPELQELDTSGLASLDDVLRPAK